MIDEKALEAFAGLMIQRIEEISADWKCPWIRPNGFGGLPQNVGGRAYNGINSFMLYLLTEIKGYEMPVFLTFNQARDSGLMIGKGAKSFPVIYWNLSVRDKDSGRSMTMEEYDSLPESRKAGCKVTPYMRHYNVFNIDQTDIREARPELYESLRKALAIVPERDTAGMFSYPPLDRMVSDNLWIVPITPKRQEEAFYSPLEELITIPLKEQFKDGESYYLTMGHEMAHSTGKLLGRDLSGNFGSQPYGREELVAELTAALTGRNIGICPTIKDENAQYLKGWLKSIKEEPKFLYSVLGDVGKASGMILESIGKAMEVRESLALDNGVPPNPDNQEKLLRALRGITDIQLQGRAIAALRTGDTREIDSLLALVERDDNPEYRKAMDRFHAFNSTLPGIWEKDENNSPVTHASEQYFSMTRGMATPSDLNLALDKAEDFMRARSMGSPKLTSPSPLSQGPPMMAGNRDRNIAASGKGNQQLSLGF